MVIGGARTHIPVIQQRSETKLHNSNAEPAELKPSNSAKNSKEGTQSYDSSSDFHPMSHTAPKAVQRPFLRVGPVLHLLDFLCSHHRTT
jgi:hypothetical protein